MDRIFVTSKRRAAARLAYAGTVSARRACAALAAALVLAAPAAAQDAAPADPADADSAAQVEDRVTVIGRRLPEQSLRAFASDFVTQIAAPASASSGYARWERRVCIGLEDVREDAAALILDRIYDVARELGLRSGAPGCAPRIVIFFVDDGPALASGMVRQAPSMFRPFGGEAGVTRGLHALEEFASSDAAVRWWHISMPVDRAGSPAIELPGALNPGPPVVAGANSFITNSVRDELWAAYVIVDTSKLEGVAWGQLADYLAMVSLAQIDPNARPGGYETILNLFHGSPSATAPGLTDWDMSYLRALYRLDRHRGPRHQRGVLASEIARHQRALEQ